MVKLVVIVAMVTGCCGSVAGAETKAPPPVQQKPQTEPAKPVPSPDEIAHWMSDSIDHILEPVGTIIDSTTK